MAGKINIDIDAIREKEKEIWAGLDDLQIAYERFETDIYGALDECNDFNSDYAEKLRNLFDNIRDTVTGDIYDRYLDYYFKVQDVTNAFEETDTQLAKQIKE